MFFNKIKSACPRFSYLSVEQKIIFLLTNIEICPITASFIADIYEDGV
jgi:hypothetical protein